jgi:hypothetical protein
MRGILTGPHAGWIQSSVLGAKMDDSEMLLVPYKCGCPHIGLVAEVEISNVMETNTVSLGDWPCGLYVARYCGGAWNFGGADPLNAWVAVRAPSGFDSPPGSEGHFITVLHSDGGGSALINESVPPGSAGYTSQQDVEDAACGASIQFFHSGGNISARFQEFFYPDNTLGTYGPIIRLYGTPWTPVIAFASAVGKLNGGTSFSATFNFTESTSWFGDVVFTLASSGGITSPSGPETVTVEADTPFHVHFTWAASTTVVTATITATVCGVVVGTFEIDVGPILTPESTSVTDEGLGCGPPQFRRYGFYFNINNTGNQNTDSPTQVTVTAVSGAVLLNLFDYCTDIASQVTNIAGILQGSYQSFNLLARKDGSGDSSAVFDFVIDDGWTTHPAARISVPFP